MNLQNCLGSHFWLAYLTLPRQVPSSLCFSRLILTMSFAYSVLQCCDNSSSSNFKILRMTYRGSRVRCTLSLFLPVLFCISPSDKSLKLVCQPIPFCQLPTHSVSLSLKHSCEQPWLSISRRKWPALALLVRKKPKHSFCALVLSLFFPLYNFLCLASFF